MQPFDETTPFIHFLQDIQTNVFEYNLPIIITSHKQADLDSLGSGIILLFLLSNLTTAKIELVFPTRSKQTESVITLFELKELVQTKASDSMNLDNCCIVLVDTNQPAITDLNTIFKVTDSLDAWNASKKKIIIDHHILPETGKPQIDTLLLLPDYNSASEVAFALLRQGYAGSIDSKVLSIALLGILYDTKRLTLATAKVLKTVATILEQLDASIDDFLPYLDNMKDYSERIANVKAGQRNKLIILQEKYLVSLSFVSSFESSSARSLQYLGSDIAAVVNRSKNEVRISFRSSKTFFDDTQIHCGELANYIAGIYKGTGSGHPTAAGCNIPAENTNNEIFDTIIAFLEKHLSQSS